MIPYIYQIMFVSLTGFKAFALLDEPDWSTSHGQHQLDHLVTVCVVQSEHRRQERQRNPLNLT